LIKVVVLDGHVLGTLRYHGHTTCRCGAVFQEGQMVVRIARGAHRCLDCTKRYGLATEEELASARRVPVRRLKEPSLLGDLRRLKRQLPYVERRSERLREEVAAADRRVELFSKRRAALRARLLEAEDLKADITKRILSLEQEALDATEVPAAPASPQAPWSKRAAEVLSRDPVQVRSASS
jgi:predicted  nucleic acid-binding Zn-ribbon protein